MRLTPHVPSECRDASATEPQPSAAPVETDDRLDEDLHYGRSWHRYRYCYRRAEGLRVLDAGCGTGRSSLAAARLNPGARVLGIDASAAAVGLAGERASGLAGERGPSLGFAAHDPSRPLPEEFGKFDFVIAQGLLARADDPDRTLAALARALDPCGLLLVTFPSRHGRQAARSLRRAVDALAAPDAGLDERTRLGLEVVRALRPDHPVREPFADGGGADRPDLTRVVLDALTGPREWGLDDAAVALGRAGLTFLYAATPWRWRPDRAFDPGALDPSLHDHLARLDPARLARLIDALDPSALGPEYTLYACPAGHAPAAPAWTRDRRDDPATFDRLVPHLTGLARPETGSAASASSGRTLFRSVSGALGELDRVAVLRLAAVNGLASCGEIDRMLASHSRASDDKTILQDCWINLADSGLILLEPRGPR